MFCPGCHKDTLKYEYEESNSIYRCSDCSYFIDIGIQYNFDFDEFKNKLEKAEKTFKKQELIKNIKIIPYDKASIESKKFMKWKNYTGETYAIAKEAHYCIFDEFVFDDSKKDKSTNYFSRDLEIEKTLRKINNEMFQKALIKISEDIRKEIANDLLITLMNAFS